MVVLKKADSVIHMKK